MQEKSELTMQTAVQRKIIGQPLPQSSSDFYMNVSEFARSVADKPESWVPQAISVIFIAV